MSSETGIVGVKRSLLISIVSGRLSLICCGSNVHMFAENKTFHRKCNSIDNKFHEFTAGFQSIQTLEISLSRVDVMIYRFLFQCHFHFFFFLPHFRSIARLDFVLTSRKLSVLWPDLRTTKERTKINCRTVTVTVIRPVQKKRQS